MNRNITLRILVAALVVTFVVSMGPLAQAASRKCSLSKLAGTYGLTTTGSFRNRTGGGSGFNHIRCFGKYLG